MFKKILRQRYHVEHQIEDLKEEVNVLLDENKHEEASKGAWLDKVKRYDSLKNIIEDINKNMDLSYAAETLVSVASSSVARNRGSCVLYLMDNQNKLALSLYKTKKEEKDLVVKAKEGDIFDLWVLRHASSLFIEDIKKDFRFDAEKLKIQDERPIGSLISVPLVVENKFLGILRLDCPQVNFYSQGDLRLLMAISDLGAVALENALLFKKTQDLAIHDELTGLYTKGYFSQRLMEECRVAITRHGGLSLLMVDIDYFKNYNDKFGHTAGDIVLKVLSDKAADFLKDFNPILSRFGGEEFCVILPGMDKLKSYEIASLLRQDLEKTKISLRRSQTNITVSVGVAYFPDDAIDAEELIRKADKAMYSAKEKGRNQVCSA
ncbi:MAG: sensor domain-containing diguanylate cyclase [Candidatus Omnitrophota bacterium]